MLREGNSGGDVGRIHICVSFIREAVLGTERFWSILYPLPLSRSALRTSSFSPSPWDSCEDDPTHRLVEKGMVS